MALAGAGGGGFLILITKQPNAEQAVTDVLAEVARGHSAWAGVLGGAAARVHALSVDEEAVEVEEAEAAPQPLRRGAH